MRPGLTWILTGKNLWKYRGRNILKYARNTCSACYDIIFFVADQAGHVVTRMLIFVHNALIVAFSKRKNMVEFSPYRSDLFGMRIARYLIVTFWVKLKTFGMPLIGPANCVYDISGIIMNIIILDLTFLKKHNSIMWYRGVHITFPPSLFTPLLELGQAWDPCKPWCPYRALFGPQTANFID